MVALSSPTRPERAPDGPVPSPALPRRDPVARARLAAVSRRAAPLVLARDRCLPVPGALGALVPGGTLQRGTVTTVAGAAGAGATSLALGLVAAATAAGEWAAAVDLPGTLGGLAARECGVELARFVVVRDVPGARWSTVVAALLDGVSLVMADVPPGLRAGDAHRLVARARERRSALVMVVPPGRRWPAAAALRLHAAGGGWSGLAAGGGVLEPRPVQLRAESRSVERGRERAPSAEAGATREPAERATA